MHITGTLCSHKLDKDIGSGSRLQVTPSKDGNQVAYAIKRIIIRQYYQMVPKILIHYIPVQGPESQNNIQDYNEEHSQEGCGVLAKFSNDC